ncbi:MAG: secretion protein [Planctomyces sp.]|nr:secretion protein [Planctomyces sp.]
MMIDLATIVPIAIFACITLAVFAALQVFSRQESRASQRLDEFNNPLLREQQKNQKHGMANLLERAAPALSKALEPKSELEQSQLKIRLANAGFHSPGAPMIYLAVKTICLAAGLILGGGLGLYRYGTTQSGLTTLIVAAGAGFYLPELVLMYLISKRKQAIFLQLPDVLDLLVVCVEAGLGLDAGLRRVSEELKDTAPEICGELAMCNLQLQMGRNRRDMLHDLGVRTGVDDVKALVAIMIQADKFGSSVAQALRVQSDSMRVKRRQIAEEKAQKTAVQMLFPMVIFIFPGIFVVLVGPAAIKMMDQLLNKP